MRTLRTIHGKMVQKIRNVDDKGKYDGIGRKENT